MESMKQFKQHGIITDEFVDSFITRVILPTVLSVRKDLALQFDVSKGKYIKYRGLCDTATIMVNERLQNYIDTMMIDCDFEVHSIHGEQRHCPKIPTSNWEYEHTWGYIQMGPKRVYYDATSSQFRFIWRDIPDYYVSTKPPKWYLPDGDSLIYDRRADGSGHISKKMNEQIKFPVKTKYQGEVYHREIGITEILVYFVWGTISDMIHHIFYRR